MGVFSEALPWVSFLTITGIWAVTVITPGPNFIATFETAISHGRSKGLLVSAGIGLGTTIWAGGSLFGLTLLFQTAGWLYLAVKWLGAAYLLWIGLHLLLDATKSAQATTTCRPHTRNALSTRGAFNRGLLVDLSNPKAAAFFTSLFAVAMPPTAPLWFQGLMIASVVITAAGWYALVALCVSWPPLAAFYRRLRRWILGFAGALFATFGVVLAIER